MHLTNMLDKNKVYTNIVRTVCFVLGFAFWVLEFVKFRLYVRATFNQRSLLMNRYFGQIWKNSGFDV